MTTHPIQKKLSLIICSRNRSRALEQCLQKLPLGKIQQAEAEIILIDSHSTDDTRQVLQEFQHHREHYVTIATARKPGLGFARNLGVSISSADTIAFTDDDCYLDENYFEKAAGVFESSDFHYCGGKILLFDEHDAMVSVNYQNRFELIPAFSFIETGKIQGANLVVHRDVFRSIGGFDPALGAGTRFRCEDIEFVARASMNGFTGAHVPELVVYHHHGRSTGSRELKQLVRSNDIARGAYYMSMILQGYQLYLSAWLKKSVLHGMRNITVYVYFRRLLRELFGAFHYCLRKSSGTL